MYPEINELVEAARDKALIVGHPRAGRNGFRVPRKHLFARAALNMIKLISGSYLDVP